MRSLMCLMVIGLLGLAFSAVPAMAKEHKDKDHKAPTTQAASADADKKHPDKDQGKHKDNGKHKHHEATTQESEKK